MRSADACGSEGPRARERPALPRLPLAPAARRWPRNGGKDGEGKASAGLVIEDYFYLVVLFCRSLPEF